jgi:hypothetical protein
MGRNYPADEAHAVEDKNKIDRFGVADRDYVVGK